MGPRILVDIQWLLKAPERFMPKLHSNSLMKNQQDSTNALIAILSRWKESHVCWWEKRAICLVWKNVYIKFWKVSMKGNTYIVLDSLWTFNTYCKCSLKSTFSDSHRTGYLHSILHSIWHDYHKWGWNYSIQCTISVCLLQFVILKRFNAKGKKYDLGSSRCTGKARCERLVFETHFAVLIHQGCLIMLFILLNLCSLIF